MNSKQSKLIVQITKGQMALNAGAERFEDINRDDFLQLMILANGMVNNTEIDIQYRHIGQLALLGLAYVQIYKDRETLAKLSEEN